MLFGKKEDTSKLPDLPPLPRSPAMNSMQSGPSFPDLPPLPSKSQSQDMGNMIQPPGRKDVVMNMPQQRQEVQKPKVVEMEEWHPSSRSEEDYETEVIEEPAPLPRMQERYISKAPQPMVKPHQVDDVFVRIDKFHAARKSLGEIQHRLDDIDELVKRIRDTKMREEQELSSWEKELMNIKARVANVTETIFEKVE